MEREGLNIWWQDMARKCSYYVMKLYKVKKKRNIQKAFVHWYKTL